MHLAALHHNPLAAHAAQIWQVAFGGKTTAIDDEIGIGGKLALAKTDVRTGGLRLLKQEVQRRLRRQMSLLGVVESAGETIDERGLGCGELCRR